MTEAKSYLREIDVRRIQRLVQAEFADFCEECEEFDAWQISVRQQLRGGLIIWAATFLPEVFPDSLQKDLREKVFGFYSEPDFRSRVWYRVLPLEIALFALTGDTWYLKTPLQNLDHHDSSLRELVFDSLAFVAG